MTLLAKAIGSVGDAAPKGASVVGRELGVNFTLIALFSRCVIPLDSCRSSTIVENVIAGVAGSLES